MVACLLAMSSAKSMYRPQRAAAAAAAAAPSTTAPAPAYNYSRDTMEAYQDASASNAGRYQAVRDRLDVSYHGTYALARQRLQDRLIGCALRGVRGGRTRPWIIFTAGAMGSGKSRTFEYLVERGIIPLQGVQMLDSDAFKTRLPEWEGYLARDPLSAGLHTRRESGYMLEIAQEAALRERRHVWVDGSLRDGEWYQSEFARLRREHPDYSIAIVHVVATRQAVLERVKRRAAVTGRHVPEAEIDDSLVRVPPAVRLLAPRVDFLAVVDNSAERPHLVEYCTGETCKLCVDDWEQIATRLECDADEGAAAAAPPEECQIHDLDWGDVSKNFEAARRTSSAASSDEWG